MKLICTTVAFLNFPTLNICIYFRHFRTLFYLIFCPSLTLFHLYHFFFPFLWLSSPQVDGLPDALPLPPMDGHYIDNGAPLSGGQQPLVRETDSMRIPLSQPEDSYSLNEVGLRIACVHLFITRLVLSTYLLGVNTLLACLPRASVEQAELNTVLIRACPWGSVAA